MMTRQKRSEKERKENVTLNYFFYLIQEAASLLSTVIVTPYISRVLGADNIGIYSFTHSIAGYAMLFAALGVTTYGVREIAACGSNSHMRSIVFYNIIILRFFSTALSLAFYCLVFHMIGEYQILFQIQIIDIMSVAFEISWLYQGENRFHVNAALSAVVKILLTIAIFSLVKSKDDLIKYCLCSSVALFVLNLAMWSRVSDTIQHVRLSELNPFSTLKPILALFIPQIAVQIYQVMDKTMLYAICKSSLESGYYEQSHRIINLATLIMTARGVALSPKLSKLYTNSQKNELQNVLKDSFQFVWFVGLPLVAGMITLSGCFVPWYFGAEYKKVSTLMRVFAPICLCIGLSNILTVYYIASKRSKIIQIAAFIGAGLNMTLNAVLIPKFLSVGAAIASVFTEFVILCLWLIFVRTEIKIGDIFSGMLKKMICATVSFSLPIAFFTTTNSGITFIVCGILSTVIYAVLLILAKDSYALGQYTKLKALFKRI